MNEHIELPAPTRARLEAWVQQREALNAMIEATLQAVREALGVPDGWVIRDVDDGFTPAPNGAGGHNGVAADGSKEAVIGN